MIIGIQMKPGGKGTPPEPSIFYCGTDAVAFRKKHAELVKANTAGDLRFFAITHPLLTPLQNVVESTEEHPDVLAAQKRREILASAPTAAGPAKVLPLVDAKARRDELLKLKLKDLQGIVERHKACGQEIETLAGTKADLVSAILKAEGLTVPAEPTEEEPTE